MALSLEDTETERLARELAALTEETFNEVIQIALHERLERKRTQGSPSPGLAEKLLALGAECAALPDFDTRPPDEILGYDEFGVWH